MGKEQGDDLETAVGDSAGFWRKVIRALHLVCPMCGQGVLFRGWIRMNSNCQSCGFQFERGPGYFLGSTYINYGLTAALTTWTYMILHFGFGVSNQALLPGLLAFCAVFPLVFFRYARSLWLSLDSYFDRVGAEESRSPFRARKEEAETLEESQGRGVDSPGIHVKLPRSPENGELDL